MLEGTHTALVTPFKGGKVDEDALRRLVREQVEAGIDGLVPCGSTGESATLDHGEHETVIGITLEEAAGRAKVIAGTGSNSTSEAVALTRFAAAAGADAALLISPYYNKPTQEGHVRHYAAVAEAVDIPIIVYNIPGRTGVNMAPETIAEMARVPNIAGLKEASGSLDHAMRVMQLCGDEFTVLSGDDPLTLPLMAVGAHGVIAVTANLRPARMKEMVEAAAAGRAEEALAIHRELLPLMQAMTLETNPIPAKAAMAMTGRMTDEIRLPLTPMTEDGRKQLGQVLAEQGLL
jgi:4-hydroxy-tetrahydrodipicolinate synthase